MNNASSDALLFTSVMAESHVGYAEISMNSTAIRCEINMS